jgi:hypothetical protein
MHAREDWAQVHRRPEPERVFRPAEGVEQEAFKPGLPLGRPESLRVEAKLLKPEKLIESLREALRMRPWPTTRLPRTEVDGGALDVVQACPGPFAASSARPG